MSLTKSDTDRISYRRQLSSFASALDPENVQQIAFIYCRESNIDCSEKGIAFRLLLKLERLDFFSFEKPGPLIQIATDARRLDWAKKFREYVDTRTTAPPPKFATTKKAPIPSEERQHLEDVHDAIVGKIVDLEDQFQELWKKELVTRDEGTKFLKKSEKLFDEVHSELKNGMKKLRNRPNSGYSSSGSSSGSEFSTSPTRTAPTITCMLIIPARKKLPW